jgi:hypothetical protein
MAYERYPRGTNPQGDYQGRSDPQDYGRDYGGGRDNSYSSARDYQGSGGRGGGYGQRDDGPRYPQRDEQGGGRSDYGGYGQRSSGGGYGNRDDQSRDQGRYGQQPEYHGSYASDGRRFEDVGRYRHADDDSYRQGRGDRDRPYGNQPQGYDYQDRGFFQRAGDEVRSWFGDDDAERRRNEDARHDEQSYRQGGQGSDRHRDSDYHNWRSGQIAAFDRDYDEYRQEHRSKFENEFASWRTNRQGQRDQLSKVDEHMEVVGSDGQHVGTVDKVRGDRVLLTKNDSDAGGRHHSFPSSWITSVDSKVTLARTAADAKQHWKDEERNQAMFQYGDNGDQNRGADQNRGSQGRSDQGAGGSSAAAASSTSTAKTY